MKIPLHHLTEDPNLYPRNQPSWVTVARYTNAMRQGKTFPPILVGKRADGNGGFVIIDGVHRFHAAKTAKVGALRADLCRLPEKEWYLESVRRNAAHGQALSPQEVRRALLRLKAEGHPVTTIADVTGVPVSKWTSFINDHVATLADGTSVVTKAVTDAGRASRLNAAELAEMELKQSVRNVVMLLDQLISLLEARNVDRRNPEVKERLDRLATLIGR